MATATPTTGGSIAPAAPRPLTIRERLNSPAQLAEIAKALPAHCKPERMARVALTALTRTPKLNDCDQASFFQAMLSLSQWGLEPDGRRAHLIPFENRKRGITEVQLIIDYKGLVELAYRSGIVKNIHADVVREGDIFEYNLGRVVKHVPWFLRRDEGKPDKAGEVFAAFCFIELTGDTVKCETLSHEEVEAIRKRSKAGQNGPWVTDWCEMAKKTAFRRASKWLPLSAEIADAFERDDDRLLDSHLPDSRSHGQSLSDLTRQLQEKRTPQTDANVVDQPQAEADLDTAGGEIPLDSDGETNFAEASAAEQEPPRQPEKPTSKPAEKRPADPTIESILAKIPLATADEDLEAITKEAEKWLRPSFIAKVQAACVEKSKEFAT